MRTNTVGALHESVGRITTTDNEVRSSGSFKAYFRGNGINILKSAPEMAVKLALNAELKQRLAENPGCLKPQERVLCGGISGVVSQVRVTCPTAPPTLLCRAPALPALAAIAAAEGIPLIHVQWKAHQAPRYLPCTRSRRL